MACPTLEEFSQCGGFGNQYSKNSFNFSNKEAYKNMQNMDAFINLIKNRGYDNKKLLLLAGCNSQELARKLSLKVKGPVMGIGGELMYGVNGIYS